MHTNIVFNKARHFVLFYLMFKKTLIFKRVYSRRYAVTSTVQQSYVGRVGIISVSVFLLPLSNEQSNIVLDTHNIRKQIFNMHTYSIHRQRNNIEHPTSTDHSNI